MTLRARPANSRQQWENDGYLLFENAVQGEELRRLQTAFDFWADACKEEWLEHVEAGDTAATYYDIPRVLERDPVFVDLVDHPAYVDCLLDFTDGDALFLAPQARTVPPWPMSYTGWHPDVGHNNPLHIKIQVYVNDVPPKSGEFAFVPGSHKPGSGPYPRIVRSESMPGHKAFPGAAGTAIMFNACGWHTGMDNHLGTPRKSIILIYEKRTENRGNGDRFAAIAPFCKTPQRRRLFGLEA